MHIQNFQWQRIITICEQSLFAAELKAVEASLKKHGLEGNPWNCMESKDRSHSQCQQADSTKEIGRSTSCELYSWLQNNASYLQLFKTSISFSLGIYRVFFSHEGITMGIMTSVDIRWLLVCNVASFLAPEPWLAVQERNLAEWKLRSPLPLSPDVNGVFTSYEIV